MVGQVDFTVGYGSNPASLICCMKKAGGQLSDLLVSTSQPVSVTRSVCSNCADLLPSHVTEVQLSGHVSSCNSTILNFGFTTPEAKSKIHSKQFRFNLRIEIMGVKTVRPPPFQPLAYSNAA